MPSSVPSIRRRSPQAQEDAVRDPDQRVADQALVQLVDEVLAREPPVQPGEAPAQPLGARGRPAEDEGGGGQADEGQHDRDDEQRRLEVLQRLVHAPAAAAAARGSAARR